MSRPSEALPLTHAGAFRRHGKFNLAACVETDRVKRDAFASFWGIDRSAESLEQLSASPHEFDVISICSPTEFHIEHLEVALEFMPRVIFCEKPLTSSTAESIRLAKSCQEKGVFLVVNYTRQWDPELTSLIAQLSSGEWGEIRSVVGFYNKGVRNNGGHLIDLLLRLLGPLEVVATCSPIEDYWNDDSTVPALLRSSSGNVPVYLVSGHAEDYSMFEIEFICEGGVIRMRDGGMAWESRQVSDITEFSGYKTLSVPEARGGSYPHAMSFAVQEIYGYLEHGSAIRSSGHDAIAIESVCEQLLSQSRLTSPSRRT